MSASLQHKIEVRGSPDPAVLALLDQAFERFNDASSKLQERYEAVSYTHLTLPTNREV